MGACKNSCNFNCVPQLPASELCGVTVVKAESGIPPSSTDIDLGKGRQERDKYFLGTQYPSQKTEMIFVPPSGAPPTSRQLSHPFCDPASLLLPFPTDHLMCLQAPSLPSTTHLLYHFQDIFLKHKHDSDKRSPLLKPHLPSTHSPAPWLGLRLYLSTLLSPRYTCGSSHTSNLLCRLQSYHVLLHILVLANFVSSA